MTGRAFAGRAVLVALLAFAAYVGYGIYTAGLDERAPPPKSTDITFKSGSASGHRIVSKSWSAEYTTIQSNADQTVLELEGVHNGIIYRHGKPYLRVRAKHMSVNTISRDFSVIGPLHVSTIGATPARSFDTTSAIWEDTLQTLTLSNHVIINTSGEAPLSIGRMSLDVKTGAIDVDAMRGPVPFK